MTICSPSWRQLLATTALAANLMLASGAMAETTTTIPGWQPKVSEQLIKLPAAVLDKRIDRDFLESSLGQAIQQTDRDLAAKTQTLADIDAAIGMANGEQAIELKHRFLVEKQDFIQKASARNRMQHDQLVTKRRLLENILERMGREEAGMTESRKALVEAQNAARDRLESSMAMADKLLSTNPLVGESRYAREYEEKRAALDSLKSKLAKHPMSQDPLIDGEALSKPDYVRHLIAVSEGEIALLEMESEMLGMMAKLTSLDALALAEEADDPEAIDSDIPDSDSIVAATKFF